MNYNVVSTDTLYIHVVEGNFGYIKTFGRTQ